MRRARRTAWRLVVAASCGTAALLAAAGPAGAKLTDPCQATGTFAKGGFTVDPKATDEVEIPRADDVAWEAGVPGSGRRRISGSVQVEFPPPIGKIEVGSWSSNSEKYQNADTYEYDLPSVLAGFDIPVTGTHRDQGFTCSGAVTVRIEGGGLKNPAALASLAFTVVSALGVFLSIRVRPV